MVSMLTLYILLVKFNFIIALKLLVPKLVMGYIITVYYGIIGKVIRRNFNNLLMIRCILSLSCLFKQYRIKNIGRQW